MIKAKKLFIALAMAYLVIMSGCSIRHNSNSYVLTYVYDDRVNMPHYLTLKRNFNSFEYYYPLLGITTVGSYETNGDTLILKPAMEYGFFHQKLYTDDYRDTIPTLSNIQKKFIMQNDELLDITNYIEQIFPDSVSLIKLNKNNPPNRFKLMK